MPNTIRHTTIAHVNGVWNLKRRSRPAIRLRNREYAIEALRAGCVDCGESDLVVLDFDHRDDAEKKSAISDLIKNCASLEVLQAEIEKCEVRCANCHRRRTAKVQGWHKHTAGSGSTW